MSGKWLTAVVLAGSVVAGSGVAGATEMRIHLEGTGPVTGEEDRFTCDAAGVKLGLPEGVFTVQYLNTEGNGLAVLPVGGKSIIFVSVAAGSGTRYVSGKWIWRDGGSSRGASLSIDWLGEQATSLCHEIVRK